MGNADFIKIDRALHELRCGREIIIDNISIFHPEFITESKFNQIKSTAKLVITKHRAQALGNGDFTNNAEISLANLSFDDLQILTSGQKIDKKFEFANNDNKIARACIELVKTAELLPAIICDTKNATSENIKSENIITYLAQFSQNLQIAAEAPLNLYDADNARIIAFRSAYSSNEHYSIIIGELGTEPLVRIHSSCYTGDLLGSLSCDCGDQLRGAIKLMNEAGGGVIIYLMQEGRGIGLINKLRTYKLQSDGLDTVQANEFLGFDDEERSFGAAAAILKSLKIQNIKLVTNNPKKISGLEELGIKVTGRVPLIVSHEHNKTYLQTKSEKSGHIIN